MKKKLTAEELALIAGSARNDGEEVDDPPPIVVTGSPPPPIVVTGSPPPPIVVTGSPPPPIVVTGSPPPPPPPHPEQPDPDCGAKAIGDAITAAPNSNVFEYQGFVYRDQAGKIRSTQALTSNEPNTVRVPQSDFNIPAGSVQLGMVHSHPHLLIQDPNTGSTQPLGPEQRELASLPSHIDMQNMYDFGLYLQQINAPNWQDYSIYIAFDGTVRKFAWKDQDWSKLSNNQGQATWANPSSYEPCT